jgi:hypothetical protein
MFRSFIDHHQGNHTSVTKYVWNMKYNKSLKDRTCFWCNVTIVQLHIDIVRLNLTFMGPCIVIYSYSTTNKMHLFFKLFILVKHCKCVGRSFRPSSGAQDCTYSIRHMSNSCCYLLLAAAVWHIPDAVCAVLNSWWWKERPTETFTVFYKNK